jgi:Flp pilus assembly protein TadG
LFNSIAGMAARLRAALASRRGVAAIEFAAVLPVMVVVITGTYDLGNLVQMHMKLGDAVRAGGQYAMSYPLDNADIEAAVTASLPSAWRASASVNTPVMACYCWDSGGGSETTTDCTTPGCAAGESVERFVTVSASLPYAPLLLRSYDVVNASFVARVQ